MRTLVVLPLALLLLAGCYDGDFAMVDPQPGQVSKEVIVPVKGEVEVIPRVAGVDSDVVKGYDYVLVVWLDRPVADKQNIYLRVNGERRKLPAAFSVGGESVKVGLREVTQLRIELDLQPLTGQDAIDAFEQANVFLVYNTF